MPNKRKYPQQKSDKRSINRIIIISAALVTVVIVVALIVCQGPSETGFN